MTRGWQLAPLVTLYFTLVFATPALAHDPSSWGGLFRSRDGGATWFVASEGRFVTAALDVAVDPTDPNHLLLATDGGLLRSRNGGRDWAEAGGPVRGLVLAASFSPDAELAFASTAAGLFLSDDGAETWRPADLPPGTGPVDAIRTVPGGRLFVAAGRSVLRSDDRGMSWQDVGRGLPDGRIRSLIARPAPGGSEQLYAVVDGRLFVLAGPAWRPLGEDLPEERVDVVALGPIDGQLWAAGGGRVYRSDDAGLTWRPTPGPLDPPSTRVRAIQASDQTTTITVATDRGLYRSGDGGASWESLTANVPIHLEAGPLARDPSDPETLYAGFAVTPYDELRGQPAGAGRLPRLDAINLTGAAAFLLLLFGGGGLALRRLARYYRPARPPATEPALPVADLGNGPEGSPSHA